MVIVVELVNYHNGIDVAEWNETDSEDAQCITAFDNHIALVSTKEHHNAFGPYPYVDTGDDHCHGDEVKRLAQHQRECLVITLAHLDGAKRLDRAACAGNKEIVDVEDVHADGEGEDACASQGRQHNRVGTVEQSGQADGSESQRGALREDLTELG